MQQVLKKRIKKEGGGFGHRGGANKKELITHWPPERKAKDKNIQLQLSTHLDSRNQQPVATSTQKSHSICPLTPSTHLWTRLILRLKVHLAYLQFPIQFRLVKPEVLLQPTER